MTKTSFENFHMWLVKLNDDGDGTLPSGFLEEIVLS